ncbi:MAG: class I SAM-dependent RNA methyltransferase [Acidimicrobiales bacterium]|nr:class I SAM-dependent RNA methyltransferase [Acidimicrobiales bacterium]
MPGPEPLVLVTEGAVAGGAALARHEGRVVFVEGALPGERVVAEVFDERRDFARARVASVLDASPHRVPPPCPHVAAGCGGCDWQHADPAAQPRLKGELVVDALRRLGKVPDPVVRVGPPLAPEGFRTTVRLAVHRGRVGFRHRGSHEVVPVGRCLVAHPLVQAVLDELEPGRARELTVRAGARTGEQLVLATPTAGGVRVPEGVVLVGRDELRRGRRAAYHEEVGGRRYRIAATSFFQTRADGADALVAAVADALGPPPGGDARLVDAYCGVGLFAGALAAGAGQPGWRVVALESHRAAVADARHNLDDRQARVLGTDVGRWRLQPADAVVADPSRRGLGRDAAAVLAATGATRLVLVACDAAALGRDVALLAGHGFGLADAVLVDLFPQTSHVEVVARFDRG